MSLSLAITTRLEASYRLFNDLVESLDEASLGSKLPGLRSNTIGDQFWCVIGCREIYAKAIEAESWQGFGCSLTGADVAVKSEVCAALANSVALVKSTLETAGTFSNFQDDYVVALLEHEAAHQGQLIRYLYGLNLEIPQSWKDKHALE